MERDLEFRILEVVEVAKIKLICTFNFAYMQKAGFLMMWIICSLGQPKTAHVII